VRLLALLLFLASIAWTQEGSGTGTITGDAGTTWSSLSLKMPPCTRIPEQYQSYIQGSFCFFSKSGLPMKMVMLTTGTFLVYDDAGYVYLAFSLIDTKARIIDYPKL
jgi:hypothetical protein